MLYSENQMIDLIRKAGVLPMNDDWPGIGGNTLSSTLGMGGTTPDPASVAYHPFSIRAEDLETYNKSLEKLAKENTTTDEEKRRRKACPNKSLTQHPSRYLTGLDGSPCVKIEPEIVKWKEDSKSIIAMDFGKGDEIVCVEAKVGPDGEIESIRGIDTDEFHKQCEDIDKGES